MNTRPSPTSRPAHAGWRRTARAALASFLAIGGSAAFTSVADATSRPWPSAKIHRRELIITGTKRADTVVLRLSRLSPELLVVDFGDDGRPGGLFIRRWFDRITITSLAGDDTVRIDEANGTFTDTESTTIDTGGGIDVVAGGLGNETISSGPGNDVVDAGRGNDTAVLGAGDDRFAWDPGEGDDVVEGDDGYDSMLFNGSNDSERFELLPADGRVQLTRDVGAITMDFDGVEQLDLAALEGSDTVVTHDLAGTDLAVFNAGLEAAFGSVAGDAQTDFISVSGTEHADGVTVTGSAGNASITGLASLVNIHGAALPDVLQVLGFGGDDAIDASGLAADAIGFGASGDAGADLLFGGGGADSLNGGLGTDLVDGGPSDDSVFMGPDDDTFQWNPGDGSDIVGGEDGHDVMLFNGSDADENVVVAGDGFGGATLTRDVDDITMQLDRLEQIDVATLEGADQLLVDDLSDFRGTGVDTINADLAADGEQDTVTVTGSEDQDFITVAGAAGTAAVTGLTAVVNVTAAESSDRLTVNALGADDTIDATALAAGVLAFTADGAEGDDTLLGGPGDDTFSGGNGADVLFAGSGNNLVLGNAGDDTLRGEEGDDVLDGGDGNDVLIGNAGDDIFLNGEVVVDE